MNSGKLTQINRQIHRWLALVFSFSVATNFIVRAIQSAEPSAWITYAPLPPLFLLMLSGMIMFAQTYVRRTTKTATR